MPLSNVAFPANSQFFFSILRDVVTFDVLPTDFIKEDIFEFSETQTDSVFFEIDIFTKQTFFNLFTSKYDTKILLFCKTLLELFSISF